MGVLNAKRHPKRPAGQAVVTGFLPPSPHRYSHGPMVIVKKLKLRLRAGDPDPPERRKRCTSSREEEEDGD